MDKKEAFKIVYEDLTRPDGCGLFRGIYNARNGGESFMYGINTVIEYITYYVDEETYEKFNNMFIGNMIKSEEKYGKA